MKICCISDTHSKHDYIEVPPCDILIHAGDCTNDIGKRDLRNFCIWFERQPAKHKIFIAGNHDGAFEKWPDLARAMVKEYAPSVVYLEDSGVEIEGLKIWGSPMTPTFFNWFFNRDRGIQIQKHWDLIPKDTNILITHGPAAGILDDVWDGTQRQGCEDLLKTIESLENLKLHIFGHFHLNGGISKTIGNVIHVNAAMLDDNHNPTRNPVIIEI